MIRRQSIPNERPQRPESGAQRRRGVITAWSVGGIMLACLCTAFVVNHLWIYSVRCDAIRCAEATALSAAQNLLSDDLLRPRQHAFEQQGRIARSRGAAMHLAQHYHRTSMAPPLDESQIHYAATNGRDSEVPSRIVVSWNTNSNNASIPLFLSHLTGRKSAVIGVESAVQLQHCPVGFTASRSVSIPAMPFAIPDDDGLSETPSWSRLIEGDRGADRYSWNAVKNQIENGPDGLPEITLTLSAVISPPLCDTLQPLQFSRPLPTTEFVCRWIKMGLNDADLNAIGAGEIRFPATLPTFALDPKRLREICDALSVRKGDAAIYFITAAVDQDSVSSTDNSTGYRLTRPVAARVVEVHMVEDGRISVTLQPCVLTTTTAIMDPKNANSSSRYVYDVRLVH